MAHFKRLRWLLLATLFPLLIVVGIKAYNKIWLSIIDMLGQRPKSFDEIGEELKLKGFPTKSLTLSVVLALMEERGYIELAHYWHSPKSAPVEKYRLKVDPILIDEKRQNPYLVPA